MQFSLSAPAWSFQSTIHRIVSRWLLNTSSEGYSPKPLWAICSSAQSLTHTMKLFLCNLVCKFGSLWGQCHNWLYTLEYCESSFKHFAWCKAPEFNHSSCSVTLNLYLSILSILKYAVWDKVVSRTEKKKK